MIRRLVGKRGDGDHCKGCDVGKGTAGVGRQGDGGNCELWGAAKEMPEETLIQQE